MNLDFEVDKEKDSKDNKQDKKSFKLLLIKIKRPLIILIIFKTRKTINKINLENT